MISYASSWFAYIATREGGAYLVDNGVSTIAHSEPLFVENAAWFRASPTKVPELKGWSKVELDETSWGWCHCVLC